MNAIIALLVALLTWGIYRLACYYLRRSQASFRAADRVGAEMHGLAQKLLEGDIPIRVAKLVIGMAASAGCGCFVRGMIVAHYVPRWMLPSNGGSARFDSVFEQIENLDSDTRQLFWQFQVAVMAYDSFRNPFQGWLFRRALRSMLKVEASYGVKREAQSAIFSVVSRRKNHQFDGLIAT